MLLARLSPLIPYILLNYAFSVTAVRFRDYMLATWIGMLPAIVLGPAWEQALGRFKDAADRQSEAEAGEAIRRLVQETNGKLLKANADGRDPVALVDGGIRLLTQALMIKHGCRIPVVAVEEVDGDITADVLATVGAKRAELA